MTSSTPQKKLRFRKESTSAKEGTLAKAKADVPFLTAKTKAAESQNMPGGYINALVNAKSAAVRAKNARSRGGSSSSDDNQPAFLRGKGKSKSKQTSKERARDARKKAVAKRFGKKD